MQKIIIDTDLGDDIDDAIAIAYALCRKDLDVIALTTATGLTGARCHLARALADAAGRGDSLEIAAGQPLPMRPFSAEERSRFLDLGESYVFNHIAPATRALPWGGDCDAAGLIIRLANRYPGEVGVVCIGPMTNVASAMLRDPALGQKLRFVYAMGGETALNRKEHNVAFDPVAAGIVLAGARDIFLATWDVSRRFFLTPEDCARLKGSALTDLLSELIALWWPVKGWKLGPVMYDIAPIIQAEFPEGFYTSQNACIEIPLDGPARGMTILSPGNPNARVTVGMEERDVKELFFGTLKA